MLIILNGCALFSAHNKEKYGQIQFFITDSTGTERYTFHVNEPIFVHFKLINNTDHDIYYYKLPYGKENELFFYRLCPPDNENALNPVGFPPSYLKLLFLPKHMINEQVYKIEALKANEYTILLDSFIMFKYPNEIDENFKTKYHINVKK
jgi:hypothetical protein